MLTTSAISAINLMLEGSVTSSHYLPKATLPYLTYSIPTLTSYVYTTYVNYQTTYLAVPPLTSLFCNPDGAYYSHYPHYVSPHDDRLRLSRFINSGPVPDVVILPETGGVRKQTRYRLPFYILHSMLLNDESFVFERGEGGLEPRRPHGSPGVLECDRHEGRLAPLADPQCVCVVCVVWCAK